MSKPRRTDRFARSTHRTGKSGGRCWPVDVTGSDSVILPRTEMARASRLSSFRQTVRVGEAQTWPTAHADSRQPMALPRSASPADDTHRGEVRAPGAGGVGSGAKTTPGAPPDGDTPAAPGAMSA